MREIATKEKPVFVQANSNSGQGHVLHYITSFCVVFRLSTLYFWLAGKTETKQVVNRMSKWVEGGGSWKGHVSGQAVFFFLAASPLVLARFAREFRGYAAPAPGSTKPPCYAGYDGARQLIVVISNMHYNPCYYISFGSKVLKDSYSQTRSSVPPKNTLLMNLLFKSWICC